MTDLFAQLAKALENGEDAQVVALTQQALAGGASARDILEQGLFTGMGVVGRLFRDGELFLPEVLLSARAMNGAIAVLEPHLAQGSSAKLDKVVLGTVRGDMHDIGKSIVGIMMRGAGYQVVDLGIDVPVDKFVSAVKELRPVAVGLSALLTTTMVVMKDVIDALKAAGLRDQVKVLIGGAAVTQRFADDIGADGYAENAYGAVALLKGE